MSRLAEGFGEAGVVVLVSSSWVYMLSAETATGGFPERAVEVMDQVARQSERYLFGQGLTLADENRVLGLAEPGQYLLMLAGFGRTEAERTPSITVLIV